VRDLKSITHELRPRWGLILGSGLGALVEAVEPVLQLPYGELPAMLATTAPGHRGRLTCGRLGGIPLAVLEGRSHDYEGHDATATEHGVRLLTELGVECLILTNAAGGLHPDLTVGEIVVLEDMLDLTFRTRPGDVTNCDTDREVNGCRPEFDKSLRELALRASRRLSIPARSGIYAAVTGPNYETRAEYRLYRGLGADVIGMSTAPELQAASRNSLRVLGLSTVTNCCRPDALAPTSGQQVVAAAASVVDRVLAIVRAVIADCP
jgi:purine-nucleoside phosphorylase